MTSSSLFDLSGKKALVTGGAAGLGRSCAVALAAAGADVAIIDRNEKPAAEAVEAIRRVGRDALFISCDVSKQEEVRDMIEGVARRFGRLDIAVNNAGIFRAGIDETYSIEDWDQVVAINLTGTWLCAQAEMRQMAKQTPTEGKIINVASIGAHTACSNAAYDASKAAIVHMSRTLAARWGRYNINVNCVSPGYIGSVFGRSRSAEERRLIRELTPLGHVQRLEDLHGPIVFLASRASDYVTGQNLIVDGGHTLGTWTTPFDRSASARVDPADEIDR